MKKLIKHFNKLNAKSRKVAIQTALVVEKLIKQFNKLSAKSRKVAIQSALAVGVLVIGVLVSKLMSLAYKPPVKTEHEIAAPLVNAQSVYVEKVQMKVEGFGTVRAKKEVTVVPQVSGKVVAVDKDFVNGGFFDAGTALIVIEQRDYALAVESSAADVAGNQVLLERQLAEAELAAEQWNQLHPDRQPSSSLVLHEPQICQAKAQLRAAEANLDRAKLDLERTSISMPFDGRVSSKSVDTGQYLIAGQPVAEVYGTDVVEIAVPLEDGQLAWFDVPMLYPSHKQRRSSNGSEAVVIADFAGLEHRWTGRVVRTEGQIDASSRLVNVVVEVANPFESFDNRPPLVPGMFVAVTINGKEMENIIRLPRQAVHNGDKVWIANTGRLCIREVVIIRRDKNFAYVTAGLEDGDIIVTSPLDTVTDGMAILVAEKD